MTTYRLGLAFTLCGLGLAAPMPKSDSGYGALPFHFESNDGQWDGHALYSGMTSRYRFSVERQGFRLTLATGGSIGFQLSGANRAPVYSLRDALPGQSSYLLGADAKHQYREIRHYRRVHAASVYPGIDAVYYGMGNDVEYDFVVAAHASPAPISLRISGAAGVSLDRNGDLLVSTGSGELRQHRPVAYQWNGGRKEFIDARYVLRDSTVSFALGPYDTNRPLIIDPSFAYSVFFSMGGVSGASSIAVDAQGSAYVAGSIREGNLNRGYVIKLSPSGDAILSSFFFAGGTPSAIRIDAAGAAYLAGLTDAFPPGASNLPVRNAFQSTLRGGFDFFLAKLNPAGNDFEYCTYLGGTRNEDFSGAPALAVDAAGAAYFIGSTLSADMPLSSALQTSIRGISDAYIAKLNPAGNRLDFATYFGSSGQTRGLSIGLDPAGSVVFTLLATTPADLPQAPTFFPAGASGPAYIGKLSPTGTSLLYSGILPFQETTILPEPSGEILIGGNVITGTPLGWGIFRLNAPGNALTTLRQYGSSSIRSLAVDASGNIYAAGTGNSTEFRFRQIMGPGGGPEIFADAYLMKLTASGTPIYATYAAGSDNDFVGGLAVDSTGAAYLAGGTNSGDYPQAGHLHNKPVGVPTAFVTKIIDTPDQRIARVTVATLSELGVKFNVDGVDYDRDTVFFWAPGSVHTVSVAQEQFHRGVRYRFTRWSNGGAMAQAYTVPDQDEVRLTVTLEKSIFLDASVSPPGTGTLVLNPLPAADGYYPLGLSVTATIVPAPGFTLAGWTGRVTGTSPTVTVPTTTDVFFVPPSITANLTNLPQTHATAGLGFVPVRPCRIVDTRAGEGKSGAFGPPHIASQSIRSFPIPQGACGVPANAKAYSLNITVAPMEPLAYISVWPSGRPQPQVSTLNAFEGQVVANAAIVPAGDNGAIEFFASNNTHAILDINGYFTEPPGSEVLYYYPLIPCRRADTRTGNAVMQSGETRNFPIGGACGVPSTARAFALNVTAVPRGALAYLSAWATGTAQPLVSTLNSFQGRVVANAAIVPAGNNGAISVYASNATDVVLDVNGYFAPASSSGLRFYAVQPCRAADTRPGEGFSAPNGSPAIAGNAYRTFSLLARCGLPSLAQAYSLNVTLVPPQPVSFVTLFPSGNANSFGPTSTLNAFEGQIVANAAIVRGNAGSLNAFASHVTDIILDVNGYFAP